MNATVFEPLIEARSALAPSRFVDASTRSIVVFRALHLGDLLCTVPAFRALRAAAPNARIALIGLPWARAFVERFDAYIDEFIEFPGYPGFPERDGAALGFRRFLRDMQARQFDAAIQLHGSGQQVNAVVALCGARRSGGFMPANLDDHHSAAALSHGLRWPHHGNEIRRYLQLIEFLGVPPRGEYLEFPLTAADQAEWQSLRDAKQLGGAEYVCLHAGAKWSSRRWPIDRFIRIGQDLLDQGWSVVLTGNAAEADLTKTISAAMQSHGDTRVIDCAGQTTLGGLAALVACARLLVSNDTGISHIAAAVGTPSVVIASGSDVSRWAPLNRVRHRVLSHQVPCRPCGFADCPIGHPCAQGVSVESARAAIAEQLQGGTEHAA